MRPVADIADLREKARRRLPHPIFEFIDGAAYSESTLRANCAAWSGLHLRQRVLTGVDAPTLATTVMGLPSRLPMIISPTGMSGMVWRRGEIAAARAAEAAGVPYCLAMMSSCTIEDVAAATTTPPWMQMAPLSDRGAMSTLLGRAGAVGCPALVVTVTWPFAAHHYRLTRNRFDNPSAPPSAATALAFLAKPGWLFGVAMRGKLGMANFADMPNFTGSMAVIEGVDGDATWDDVAWIRDTWPGKMMIKGILDVDDAERAIAVGADSISVSNHGGNQLDHAPSTAAVLAPIVQAINGRIEVVVDGGIRSGHDVLKALALGARGCLLGRAHLFGLAAMGEAGVAKALSILREELSSAMRLTGAADVQRVPHEVLWRADAQAA